MRTEAELRALIMDLKHTLATKAVEPLHHAALLGALDILSWVLCEESAMGTIRDRLKETETVQ